MRAFVSFARQRRNCGAFSRGLALPGHEGPGGAGDLRGTAEPGHEESSLGSLGAL